MPTYIEFELLNNNEIANRSLGFVVGEENSDGYLLTILRLAIVSLGLPLNLVVVAVIIGSNRSMRTASNCYVMSIVISNLIVTVQILLDVLKQWIKFCFHTNGVYVAYLTLEASVLTLVIFALERYVAHCHPKSQPGPDFGFSQGAKGVLVIWAMAATFAAMELNLKFHFLTSIQGLIFLASTAMFLFLPTLVIITLGTFVLIDTGSFENTAENDATRVFVALAAVFYVSMAPYRMVSLVRFMAPTLCCSQTILDASYLIVELSAAVNPILYALVSRHFRAAFKETLCGFFGGRGPTITTQIL
ncbi:thyrotropin-releasing hormone receptor [Neodiprion pinetum]|uniref:Thyrotropin-releasing hormone receptor-like n=1 Tax=Neodiprion lecontei TaxID=441921 RepID=A0A6J0C6L2_NEOLC|nr:thyrotropin-releasing hormone receptor-like [Neodiprion lecontei]XP_046493238.1 thyrotropin-releasing hormone receptor-like [Neodiprion pinetum]